MFQKCFSVICTMQMTLKHDAKTFLKHFSDCLFHFCSTCADCLTELYLTALPNAGVCFRVTRPKGRIGLCKCVLMELGDT